jgi:tripeptide aminopeptidase
MRPSVDDGCIGSRPVATPLLDLFLELCAIPSPPGEERAVADRVLAELRGAGLRPDEDGTGPETGSTAGNLYCRLPATDTDGGTPIMLCAHLDTVPFEGRLEPVVEDGVVRNAGGAILGADNKSAVVAMLDASRRIVEERRPHAGIELLFTTKEEVGLVGAVAFDHSRLEARLGYVYDQAAPIGEIVLGAPFSQEVVARFHGRAAHAGMYPEEGRSAIAAAARAVADLRLGRLDDQTTANVGLIRGGTARNIVPEWCTIEIDARSHEADRLADLVREMLETIGFAATLSDCEVETTATPRYRGYRFRADEQVVRVARAGLERAGYEPTLGLSGGAADANVFNDRGLPCLNLANGMAQIHTPDEHIAVADLEGMVEVTLGIVDAARDAA